MQGLYYQNVFVCYQVLLPRKSLSCRGTHCHNHASHFAKLWAPQSCFSNMVVLPCSGVNTHTHTHTQQITKDQANMYGITPVYLNKMFYLYLLFCFNETCWVKVSYGTSIQKTNLFHILSPFEIWQDASANVSQKRHKLYQCGLTAMCTSYIAS